MDKRVFGLDVMRALAISAVVWVHSLKSLRLAFDPPKALLPVDGVSLFFVLSGFLVGKIIFYTIHGENWRELPFFLKRRWWRTLPNYYLFFFLHVLVYFAFGIQDQIDWQGLLFLQNLNQPNSLFFLESWSLAVEEWFYFLIPTIWWSLKRWLKPCDIKHFLIFIVLFIFASLCYKYWFFSNLKLDIHVLHIYVRRPVLMRLSSIGYGLLMAAIAINSRSLFKKWWIWAFVGLALYSLFEFYIAKLNTQWKVIYMFEFRSAIIMCFLPAFYHFPRLNHFLSILINRISLFSYSIYLINLPALSILFWFLSKWNIIQPFLVLGGVALTWMCIFFASQFIYYKFEWPITQLRERR